MPRGSFFLLSAKIHLSAYPSSKFLAIFAVAVFRMRLGSANAFTAQVLVPPGMFISALGGEETRVLGEQQFTKAERV